MKDNHTLHTTVTGHKSAGGRRANADHVEQYHKESPIMEKSELIATLQKLHTELSQTNQADPKTVDRLYVLTGEIQQLLERSEIPPEDSSPTTHGLRELLLKFEAEHPQFSELLGRIADGLSRMGI